MKNEKNNSPGRTVKASRSQKNKGVKNTISLELLSIALFMLSVFLYVGISKISGLPQDTEFLGILGTYMIKALQTVCGEGARIIAIYLLLWSIHIGLVKKYWSGRMWGVSILALGILVAISLYNIPGGMDAWQAGKRGMGGGYLGGAIAFALTRMIGNAGTIILLVLGFLVSVLLISNQPLKQLIAMIISMGRKLACFISPFLFYEDEESGDTNPKKTVLVSDPLIIDNTQSAAILPEGGDPQPDHHMTRVSSGKLDAVVVSRNESDSEPKKAGPTAQYQKPPLEILTSVRSERTIDKKNIRDSISTLEDTFASFGISVKVNQVSCGPAVTRYELTPAPGVKVSRIMSLTDDLQLNLAAPGIRLEVPIPGKSAIGIEVPNKKILSVGLLQLLTSPIFAKLDNPLAFALGEDITGNPVVSCLHDMPHLLIAGSTGSGKSVCLNSIIMSFLFNTTPDQLKMVFIDPKMVELTVYNGIPHLMTPVVTNPKKASVILRWMVTEMEKRYTLFSDKGVRDIQRYNQANREQIPYIVIVIDELADLMMVAPVEVEDSICRLAQKSRAAGMHLIVATQRPSVDVVTGVIKANIPSRIAFAVSSQADSRTILDIGGAEKLLGKGDMLFCPVGAAKPSRVQGAYVSDSEIDDTVNFIKQQGTPVEETEDLQEIETSMEDEEESDALFWEAVNIFVESRKASVSLLQRRLRIGYARAARLVDLMEERSLVSELDNNKKREILINKEQLEKLYARNKL